MVRAAAVLITAAVSAQFAAATAAPDTRDVALNNADSSPGDLATRGNGMLEDSDL